MRYLSVCSGIGGRPAIDMLGKKFGRLTVAERIPSPKRNAARWIGERIEAVEAIVADQVDQAELETA